MSSFVKVNAHCQIPCGIYNDSLRISLIKEHIETIKKSMLEIKKLSSEKNINYNQIVRWVQNKDDHADKIVDIVVNYFMMQRIEPIKNNNKTEMHSLALLHKILFYAMKAKQTTDLKIPEKIYKLTGDFEKIYFEGKDKKGSFEKLYKDAKVNHGVKIISFSQLQELKASDKNFVLIDVLSKESYQKNHIDGAISFPLGTITEKKAKEVFGSAKNIVAYCANFHCKASTMATKKLQTMGYNVLDYEGGLQDFKDQGGVISKD